MTTMQRKPSESDRVYALPSVLREYAKGIKRGYIPDSDLSHQLLYAANTIELMTSLLRDIRSNDTLTKEQASLINTLVSTP